MSYAIEVVSGPAAEPVSITDMKTYLRINPSMVDEDATIGAFVSAARLTFERLTGHICVTQTLRQHVSHMIRPIFLMRGPVTSIASVQYYNGADTLTTANTSTYQTDTKSLPAAVWFPNGTPVTSVIKRPVCFVEFAAGYATAAAVPAAISQAIKLLAAHWYSQREAVTEDTVKELPLGFKAICDLYRTGLSGNWGMERPNLEALTLTGYFSGQYGWPYGGVFGGW